ncbi:hypothetical protein [Roseobacter ponti]|uniref:Histidinol phosphate aminotransferase n=1 Tax=Roseobacter ponti TaxID=1891787 RepID=A0A858SPN6_9RHOB|nr:hypothetical protein [Roseobacter ponti]QJF50625.1 hypothetical protein G3256_05355 [Roseobacter ponti]
MENHKLGRAPDFTNACIVMFGVNLGWVLLFLFAIYGLVAAVFICLIVNHWLNWVAVRRRQADQLYAGKTPG